MLPRADNVLWGGLEVPPAVHRLVSAAFSLRRTSRPSRHSVGCEPSWAHPADSRSGPWRVLRASIPESLAGPRSSLPLAQPLGWRPGSGRRVLLPPFCPHRLPDARPLAPDSRVDVPGAGMSGGDGAGIEQLSCPRALRPVLPLRPLVCSTPSQSGSDEVCFESADRHLLAFVSARRPVAAHIQSTLLNPGQLRLQAPDRPVLQRNPTDR